MKIENQTYNNRAFRKANEKAQILVLSTTRYHWIGYYPMEVSRWDSKKLFLDTAWWKQLLGHGKDPKGASNIFDWKSREQKKIWCKCDGQSPLSPFKTLPFGRVFFLNHNVHHQNCHALGVYTPCSENFQTYPQAPNVNRARLCQQIQSFSQGAASFSIHPGPQPHDPTKNEAKGSEGWFWATKKWAVWIRMNGLIFPRRNIRWKPWFFLSGESENSTNPWATGVLQIFCEGYVFQHDVLHQGHDEPLLCRVHRVPLCHFWCRNLELLGMIGFLREKKNILVKLLSQCRKNIGLQDATSLTFPV